MKKILLFAATAALFAACTSDEATVPEVAQEAPQAVAFDTYTPAATRAGEKGVMTTSTLQSTGFGVFATSTDGTKYSSGSATPNFMYNQEVTYVSSAWTYSPLKYWPNETTVDSQTDEGPASADEKDRVSFFAYAPYVAVDGSTGEPATPGTSGIMSVNKNSDSGDPFVNYKVSSVPEESVDLLWGTVPAGGASYTAVDGVNYPWDQFTPWLNLVKPSKDQKVKFLFNHALARLGLTVVAAADQIAPGGEIDATETKIAIESITIKEKDGLLLSEGQLNLNNTTPGTSRWNTQTGAAINLAVNVTNEYLNDDLKYTTSAKITFEDASITGVTTTEKTVIKKTGTPTPHDNYFMLIPRANHADVVFSVTITYYVITKDDNVSGSYVETKNVITKNVRVPNFTNNKAYNLKLILGLTSVKLDAEVADWQVQGSTEVNLPRNNE